jgi:hypothetical protein
MTWCPSGHPARIDLAGANCTQRLMALHGDGQGGCCQWSGAPPPLGFDPDAPPPPPVPV